MMLALFTSLLLFRHLPRGFSNADLRQALAPLLTCAADDLAPGRMTYHLRRLRLRGLIERIPKTHRYQVSNAGLHTALFYLCALTRIIRPLHLNPPPLRARLLKEITRTIQRYLPAANAA